MDRLIDNLYKKKIFDREVILFMIAFKRKYDVNIYSSLMATINNLSKYHEIDKEISYNFYVEKWAYMRPEVKEYSEVVRKIHDYCFSKYIFKHKTRKEIGI